jgi:imidazolonepropionase-like amidohydrolase
LSLLASFFQVADVLERGVEALALADRKGAKICFGSDLLGTMHKHQSTEFAIRSRVQTAEAILRSATSTFAELTGLQGKVGCIAPGAFADLVVVSNETSPLDDVTVLCKPDSILMVIKDGHIELNKVSMLEATAQNASGTKPH